MRPVVFLGPTMPASEARAILDADLRPPAAAGDVHDAVVHGATTIALIDGVFDSVPAVWHKEILFALSRGVSVFGASSMGALRAAEMWPCGMVGVGKIYEAFRRGELEDDDEVAVTHAEVDDGYRCTSEAMVNVRAALERARARGVLGGATVDALVARTKARFYTERRWPAIYADCAELASAEARDALRRFVADERPNQKRDDARALLEHLAARLRDGEPAPATEPPAFRATLFWERLTASRARGPEHTDDDAGRQRRLVRTTVPDRERLERERLLQLLVDREFEAQALSLDQAAFDAAVREFRIARALTTADALRSFLEDADLSLDDFRHLMGMRARERAVLGVLRGARSR